MPAWLECWILRRWGLRHWILQHWILQHWILEHCVLGAFGDRVTRSLVREANIYACTQQVRAEYIHGVQDRDMTTDLDLATADRLSHELIRLGRLLERASHLHHHQHGDHLEKAAYALLVHLVKGGPQRARSLADAVHSDPSTVSRQISQLAGLGLIERRADPMDGRACLLAATAEGEQIYEQKRRWRNAHFAVMLEQWSAGDLDSLNTLLARFNGDFESYRDRFAAEPGRTRGDL